MVRQAGIGQSALEDVVVVCSDDRRKRQELAGLGLELIPIGEELVSVSRFEMCPLKEFANLCVKFPSPIPVRDELGHCELFLTERLALEDTRQFLVEFLCHQLGR